MNLGETIEISAGGSGSGCQGDHCGRPKTDTASRRRAARKSYNPATKEKLNVAKHWEQQVTNVLGGKNIGDNKAFDIVAKKFAVEVKTRQPGSKSNFVTMHPDSLRLKQKEGKSKYKGNVYTVAIDLRAKTPIIYWRRGVGNFQFKNMQTVPSIKDLKKVIK